MSITKIFMPTRGIVVLFLVIFSLMFFFITPIFSSCKVGGIACSLYEPQDICEQRNIEFRRSCDIYISALTIIFLFVSYIISTQLVFAFGGTKVGRFISNNFWKVLLLTSLFIALSFLYYYEPLVMDAYIIERGLPFSYWRYSKGTWLIENSTTGSSEFLFPYLALDFVFWYIISLAIVFIWNNFRKTRRDFI